MITFQGKTLCLARWAEELGTSPQRLSYQLRCCNGDLSRVLTQDFSTHRRMPYTAWGVTDKLSNWADAVGFQPESLRMKRKMFWLQHGDPVRAFEQTLEHFYNLRKELAQ